MVDGTVAQKDTDQPEPAPRRQRSRAHKVGRWTLVSLTALVVVASLLLVAVIGQRLTAPDWLRDRIETRIERNLGGMQITFGGVSLVINKGWRPRLRLRDVELTDVGGQLIAQLADAEAELAMRPLLRGQLQAKRISLSGALATLRKDSAGNVALSMGGVAPVEQAEGLPQLIETWDRLFLRPELAALVAVEMQALSLRYEDAQQGQAWTLDGGTVRLDRDGDQLRLAAGFSLLSGRDYASVIEANYSSRIGDTRADFGISVQDIAAQDVAAQGFALGWLDVLRAPISGALRGGIDGSGALAPLSATLQIGAGVLQPTDQTSPIPFNGARTYFTYAPDTQVLVFDELSVDSSWGSGVAEGSAYLGGVADGKLTDLIGQFTLTGLSINPANLYPAPLVLDGATADFQLELNPFRFSLGQMQIHDPDGVISLTGALDATDEGWRLSLDGQIDHLSRQRLLTLWPEGAVIKSREWVTNNMLGGTLSDLSFALRARPGAKPDIYAGFNFEDASIRFLKTQPPITGAFGQGTLSGRRFVAMSTKGQVVADQGGVVDISGTSFIVPDITVKPSTPALVRLVGGGSVTAILSLLNRPPLQVLRETPLPVDVAEGMAKVTGTVAFPLKKKVPFEELEFHLKGEVHNVSSSLLVPGQVLTAPVVQIEGDHKHLVLSGTGLVGPVPITAVWQREIGKGASKDSRLTGQVELSQLLVDTFGIGLPKGSVSGLGSGDFTLDLGPGKPPSITLRSDLQGLGLHLPQLSWAKPKKASGLLEIAGTLGEQTRIDRLVVQTAGLSATGTVLNRSGGGLERALLSSVRMGNWLEASVEFVGRGENAPPDLRILGGTLDMRRAEFGSSGGGKSSPLQISLSRLQITDTIALHDFIGEFRTTGGLSGPFRGKLNGQTLVTGNLVPRGGRSAVLVESIDAGGVFRSAGVLDQGRDGDFKLSLLPAKEPGEYDGTLRVTNTRVKDAPAIAALLNAISIVGLLDEMAGQGIQFTEVDAKFRLGPSKLILHKSSAVGPSIGLSMDGVYDVPTGRLNMQGTISPLYLLNSIGSILTRKGEGVIGFTYKLKGTSSAPTVQVNPLSALAPGMFREIFRTNPPVSDDGTDAPQAPMRRAPDPADGSASGR
ncbi:MAG: hypothetical protein ACI8R4_002727 [Paracoccaceae bacterium]|jgi:hypothetical protein